MEANVRPVNENDFPELAAMLDRVMTDGMTVAQLRAGAGSPAPLNRVMVAAEDGGAIVGWSVLRRGGNEPGNRAFTSVIAHPDRHMFRLSIVLSEFDGAPLMSRIGELEAAGIVFTTLAELGDTVENRRRYYEADCEAARDVPGEDSTASWQEYTAEVFEHEEYQPEGAYLALDGDRMVGVAVVKPDLEHDRLGNTFTGVAPEYRGRGIAQSLKVFTIKYAKQSGVSEILTQNDSENAPMLAVNRKLGYKRRPGRYLLKAFID